MNPNQWQTAGVIASMIIGVAGFYLARQSSIREQARLRREELAGAIADAERPLQETISQQREQFREQLTAVRDTAAGQLATANRVIERRDDKIRDLEARVDQLEDELRRGRGHGDNDAQRQPPNG